MSCLLSSVRGPIVAPGSPHLRLLQLNMRHSSYSLDLLIQFLRHDHYDIILIQDPPEALQSGRRHITGYEVFFSRPSHLPPSTPSVHRSLTAVLACTSLHAQPCPGHFGRACGIFVDTRQGKVALISSYIRHLRGEGLEDLSLLLDQVRLLTPLILISADVNGHSSWWGPPSLESNANGQLMEDFILTQSLEVLNRWPSPATFVSEQGQESWIDLTLGSPQLSPLVSSWRILSDYLGSDHRPISFSLEGTFPKTYDDSRLDWRSVHWDAFRSTLQSTLQSVLPSPLDPQTAEDLQAYYDVFNGALQLTIDECVPIKQSCWASNPWWTPALERLRRDYIQQRRRWLRTRYRADKVVANARQRAFRQAIAEAKRASWRQFCEEASEETLWSAFKKVTRPRGSRRIGTLEVDGQCLYTDTHKANALMRQFFPAPSASDTPIHIAVEDHVKTLLSEATTHSIPDVTPREVHSAIWASGAWKAPGSDRVLNMCLRQCESLLMPHLIMLFSASLRLHFLPHQWRCAHVSVVPKPGGDLSLPKGFRPISLLSCISKVLERIVTDRITFSLESRFQLSAQQFGFRRTRSTEWALWNFVHAAGLTLKARRKTVLLSLDIQSAYDRVWHAGLLKKLSTAGVPLGLIKWIGAFLRDRHATLRVGRSAVSQSLSMGVPQGSPLSPVLFLVFVDDLLQTLASQASIQAFADDIVIWWTVGKGESGTVLGNALLEIVLAWAQRWKVIFNPTKCKVLVISRLHHEPLPDLRFDGVALECVPSLRYLGVWLDSTLCWRDHIVHVSKKALGRLRLIQRGAGTLWGFHPHILHRLVQATIFPLLFFAAPVWGSAIQFQARLRPLDRVIRLGAVGTLGLLRTTSCEAAQVLAGFLPAEFQIRQRIVEFYLRQLSYGRDLLSMDARCPGCTHAVTPLDMLVAEVAHLERYGDLPRQLLQRVESRQFWSIAPIDDALPPIPSILPSALAAQRIRECRPSSAPDVLWIFTDGSVDGNMCGASAVLFCGPSSQGHPFSVHFVGLHSSTQAELVAIHLGCQKAHVLGHFRRVILVSDSQPALQSIQQWQGLSALAQHARDALCTLQAECNDLQLWWTPSHVDLVENDQADAAAKLAAQGNPTDGIRLDVPTCYTALRSRVRRHYCSRADRQWANAEQGRALYSIMPHHTGSISWTQGLSRPMAATVAQFLTGHYATNCYLYRFHLREDTCCIWCDGDRDDREHRLFECPRFEYTRQVLAAEIAQATHGTERWTWDFLTHEGRPYLAKFLRGVRAATVCSPEADADDAS